MKKSIDSYHLPIALLMRLQSKLINLVFSFPTN